MDNLKWLVGHGFKSFVKREHDWVLGLNQNVNISIACLWRLVEKGQIKCTSQDHGQQFGLPRPVDAADEVCKRIIVASIIAVELRSGTLDLQLSFDNGHVIEIIPDSTGYEAWQLSVGSKQVIAVGGGELSTFDSKAERPGR